MNFLAHLYLSNDNPQIQIGNFIGDYVKGRQYTKYPELVQNGILLHRKIDYFTDRHPLVKKSAVRLTPYYGRYSGIIIDMFYDHFLAANWSQYHPIPLKQFVTNVHKLLLINYFKLPSEVKRFLPFLIKNRRLENYKYIHGIERSLEIMSNYSSLPAQTHHAIRLLNEHYDSFHEEFAMFIKEVREMSLQELSPQEKEGTKQGRRGRRLKVKGLGQKG
ncbi:DUF479 domain-containing protein [Marinilabiliaceae bacterium JC017]|nr:DUF479 domain-containing protein [Marinilabiliaceae bacterium JC017]